jgi:cellulose synthase (UDP-forming)
MTTAIRLNLFRFFSIIYIGYGCNYLFWRHQESLNENALLFSYALFIAEGLMFFGSLLMIYNHWDLKRIKLKKKVHFLSDIEKIDKKTDRPIKVDVFIATYNEPSSIVEQTIIATTKLRKSTKNIQLEIHLCDDGKRDGRSKDKENFKELAQKHQINYFVRESNKGFKAGNLNNAFWQTDGDLIIILDADTIVENNFLNKLLPYFRDNKMAWVQSPQNFYDIPQGKPLVEIFGTNSYVGSIMSRVFPFLNKIKIGKDIFGTDPTIFYQVILYHRNASNAAFCCGAGSIHRRKALECLVKDHQNDLRNLDSSVEIDHKKIKQTELFVNIQNQCLGPFIHHVSEDIYTSILMHSDSNQWKSFQHQKPLCRMLSPQTLEAYDKQFSRYAEGTFSIFFSRNNPIIKKGLTFPQRIAYAETFYSYFSAFWIVVFLISPIIFYFTLIPPLKAFSFDFFLRFIILNILSQILSLLAYWGISTNRSDQYFISGFWLKIRAFFKIIIGKELKFNTTPKEKTKAAIRQNLKYVMPHLAIIGLIIIGLIYNILLIAINRHPSLSAFWANNIWATYNIYQLSPIIRAAFKKE